MVRSVDFPLGASFSAVMLLAAWGFANPDSMHPRTLIVLITVVVIFVLALSLYRCIRSSGKLKHPSGIRPSDHRRNIEFKTMVKEHTEPDPGQRPNISNLNDEEPSDGASLWGAVYDRSYKTIRRLKYFEGLITAVSTVLLTCATIGFAFAAYWQWAALAHTDETLSKTLIDSNRAWLSIPAISASGQLTGKEDIPVEIYVQNVGKSPALKVNKSFLVGTITNTSKFGANAISVGRNEACDGLYPDDGGVVFFEDSLGVVPHKTSTSVGKQYILPSVQNNDGVLYVKGCFAYETMHEVHHTWFCAVVYRNGQFANLNAWEPCKDGQGAD